VHLQGERSVLVLHRHGDEEAVRAERRRPRSGADGPEPLRARHYQEGLIALIHDERRAACGDGDGETAEVPGLPGDEGIVLFEVDVPLGLAVDEAEDAGCLHRVETTLIANVDAAELFGKLHRLRRGEVPSEEGDGVVCVHRRDARLLHTGSDPAGSVTRVDRPSRVFTTRPSSDGVTSKAGCDSAQYSSAESRSKGPSSGPT